MRISYADIISSVFYHSPLHPEYSVCTPSIYIYTNLLYGGIFDVRGAGRLVFV